MANHLYNTFSLVLIVCFLSGCLATIIRDCGSENGRLNSLTVPGCTFNDDDDKCVLVKGETASMTADFQTYNQTAKADVKIWGILMKTVKVPFAIASDACTSWGVRCPIEANAVSTMTISLPVKNEYPSIPVDIEISLMDDKTKAIFCVKFAAVLKSKSKA